MAIAYNHLGPGSVKQVSYFAEQRISEIDKEITTLAAERDMWVALKKKFNPCPQCSGHGEVRMACGDDDLLVTCRGCKGSGESIETGT